MECSKADSFWFNGKDSITMGLVVCWFENERESELNTGLNFEIHHDEFNMVKHEYKQYGKVYSEPLTFTFGVMKADGESFTIDESRALNNWLTSPVTYKELRFYNDRALDNIHFYAICTEVKDVFYKGFVGKEITFECNAPFGYDKETTKEITSTSEGVEFVVNNSSDAGEYYPTIEIEVDEENLSDIVLSNITDNNSVTLRLGELFVIYIDKPRLEETEFCYTGEAITPTLIYNTDKVDVSGDLTATEKGTYEITFSLKNTYQYQWATNNDSEDITISWKIVDPYTISYELNGGTATAELPTTYTQADTVEIPDATKEHYDFLGWTGTGLSNYSQTFTIPVGSHGDRYYTANWDAYKYIVTFDANGGTTSATTKTVAYDSTYGTLPTPIRAGYTFNGWFTALEEGTQVTSATIVTLTDNQTLYALWTANTDTAYTVLHQQEQFDGSFKTITTEKLTGTTDTEVTPTVNTYTGFTSPASQTTTISGDGSTQIVYQYTRNSYTVTVTKGSGINTITGEGTYLYGANVALTYTLKDGYEFVGWTGDQTQASFVMPANDVAMNAVTKVTTYIISYTLNGGTISTANPITYTVETATFTLNNPSYEGYDFTGWTGSNGTSAQTTVTITQGTTGNLTYDAHWQDDPTTHWLRIGTWSSMDNTTITYTNYLGNQVIETMLYKEYKNYCIKVGTTVEFRWTSGTRPIYSYFNHGADGINSNGSGVGISFTMVNSDGHERSDTNYVCLSLSDGSSWDRYSENDVMLQEFWTNFSYNPTQWDYTVVNLEEFEPITS